MICSGEGARAIAGGEGRAWRSEIFWARVQNFGERRTNPIQTCRFVMSQHIWERHHNLYPYREPVRNKLREDVRMVITLTMTHDLARQMPPACVAQRQCVLVGGAPGAVTILGIPREPLTLFH
jgi:hypothetical protein